jgi:hypothetical protein
LLGIFLRQSCSDTLDLGARLFLANLGARRPITLSQRRLRAVAVYGVVLSGTQISADPSGANSKFRGKTPTTVTGLLSRRMVRPMTCGSAAKSLRHKP